MGLGFRGSGFGAGRAQGLGVRCWAGALPYLAQMRRHVFVREGGPKRCKRSPWTLSPCKARKRERERQTQRQREIERSREIHTHGLDIGVMHAGGSGGPESLCFAICARLPCRLCKDLGFSIYGWGSRYVKDILPLIGTL